MLAPDAPDKTPDRERQDHLADLVARVRERHVRVGLALADALNFAMDAGDALLAARQLVPAGGWGALLRNCDLSERSARVYQQVAKSRALLERQSSAGRPLSIAAALEYLKDPEASRKRSTKTKASASATSFDALAWWGNASGEARQRFFDGIGLLAFLAALPPDWRIEIERRATRHRAAGTSKLANTLSSALKTALSLQAGASAGRSAAEVANALNAINNKLKSEGLDLHDVEIVLSTNAESHRCAA
jgi:hypothetical protein